MQEITISTHKVGPDHPCFIIAEAGVNHNGDMDLARKLIDVAVEAKANAVKFQSFKADLLVSPAAPKAEYQNQTTNPEESQLDMIRGLELAPEMHTSLQKYCEERGIIFMSTPFDKESSDLLHELGVPVYKIPSGETVNLPFLKHIARKGLPIILSTGMSYLSEVEDALQAINEEGNYQVAVLHCVSNYPALASDANLRAMSTMAQALKVPVGFSDHTLGIEIPLAAVALGASVIEKHFTLDSSMPGPDHRASLEPDSLAEMVRGIRSVESALGSAVKEPTASESDNRVIVRRSLFLRRDVAAKTKLTEDDLIALRPGGGIPPNKFSQVLGRESTRSLTAGNALEWSDLT